MPVRIVMLVQPLARHARSNQCIGCPTREAGRANISAVHRDTFFNCPRCACGLDPADTHLSCGQCHGSFIPEKELIDDISGRQAQALLAPNAKWNGELTKFVHSLGPVVDSPEPTFSCPRCATQMTKHQLFGVTLDRCRAHGVWLDGNHELQKILASALAGL